MFKYVKVLHLVFVIQFFTHEEGKSKTWLYSPANEDFSHSSFSCATEKFRRCGFCCSLGISICCFFFSILTLWNGYGSFFLDSYFSMGNLSIQQCVFIFKWLEHGKIMLFLLFFFFKFACYYLLWIQHWLHYPLQWNLDWWVKGHDTH